MGYVHSTTLTPSLFMLQCLMTTSPFILLLLGYFVIHSCTDSSLFLSLMFLKVVFSSFFESSPVPVSPGGSPSMPGPNPAYTPQVSGRRSN